MFDHRVFESQAKNKDFFLAKFFLEEQVVFKFQLLQINIEGKDFFEIIVL